jgi:hypothetical protein
MTDLDRLPPDQRAVLSLVLERGKSYDEVAQMLAIPESAVRDRAHAALDALARETTGVSGSRRVSTGSSHQPRAEASGMVNASGSQRPRDPRAPRRAPSSRLGGTLLLGAILAAIVVTVAIVSSGGGKSSNHPSTTASNTTSTSASTSASNAGKPRVDKTIALTSVNPEEKANGVAYVLSEKGRYAFYVAARGLPSSSGFFYAVWLYNSPSSSAALGRAPTVESDGRMEGGGPLPTNAGDYAKLIITRETSTHPSHPGPQVLSGSFALH